MYNESVSYPFEYGGLWGIIKKITLINKQAPILICLVLSAILKAVVYHRKFH